MTNALEIGIGRATYGFVMGFARRVLGLHKRDIVLGDITIPVLTRDGRGEPLVFIHGFGADKEGWLSLIGKLRGRPIVALDLPGFGAASTIDPARAIAVHQARAVKSVLDALDIPHAIVIGSSMGGGIALQFASDFPETTRGVVLLGSVGPIVDKSPLNRMLDEGRNPLIPSSREEFLAMLDFVTEKKIWVPRTIASYLASKQIARRDALTKMFEAWIGQDPSEIDRVLAKIEAPTLVIHGERDRAIDISTGRFMAERISNAKLIELAGVGHVPQLEATSRVARAIKELA